MKRTTVLLLVCALLTISAACLGKTLCGDFCPGSGADLRTSDNYVIGDTLGQCVVGQSQAPDDTYACNTDEHGFWHSSIHIPSVAEVKQAQNYQWVDTYAKVVTAGNDALSQEFYVEEQDRTSGLRVKVGSNPGIHVSAGDMVDVSGIIKGTDADRYIDTPTVTVRFSNTTQIGPLFSVDRGLGGKGTDMRVPGGAGALNTSLLVKVSGNVTYVDTANPVRYFYIDDGSGMSDGLVLGGQVTRGIRVSVSNLATGNTIAAPSMGEDVAVTGVCATYAASGKIYAQIRPRGTQDIAPLP